MANFPIEQLLWQAGRPEAKPRALDETELDPIADGWTIRLWHATADLFACRYFHREEGSRDSMGRMRPSHIRHCVIGSVADQAAAKVMAGHFCATVRRLARQHAAGQERKAALRRSFEAGCAARLADRIRKHAEAAWPVCKLDSAGPVQLALESGSGEGLEALLPNPARGKKRSRRTAAEIVAEAAGIAAAEGLSLVVRIGDGSQARQRARVGAEQTAFGF